MRGLRDLRLEVQGEGIDEQDHIPVARFNPGTDDGCGIRRNSRFRQLAFCRDSQ